MKIEPIARFCSPFTGKFGIPRQSGIVEELRGTIVLTEPYRQAEALRGLDSYDYLWLIWGFSEHVDAEKHPTVRPPLLGGNERMGVWATRSPFRPNNLGLSSVRIAAVRAAEWAIDVWGADLMDGTPIYDIKPYVAYADAHPEANCGFVDQTAWESLEVVIPEHVASRIPADHLEALRATLAQDPRPAFHDDPERVYGMPYLNHDVRFRVKDGVLEVLEYL